MKKFLVSALITILILSLSACSNAKSMTIAPAALSDNERSVAEMVSDKQNFGIFDYSFDDSIKQVSLAVYQLDGENWVKVHGDFQQLIHDGKGRLAMSFDKIPDEAYFSVYSPEGVMSRSSYDSLGIDLSAEGWLTSFRESPAEIIADKEIPLAIQIFGESKEGGTHVESLDTFYNPKKLSEMGYSAVFIVTATFLQTGEE